MLLWSAFFIAAMLLIAVARLAESLCIILAGYVECISDCLEQSSDI